VIRLIELVEGREELAQVRLLEVCEEGMNRLAAIDNDSVNMLVRTIAVERLYRARG